MFRKRIIIAGIIVLLVVVGASIIALRGHHSPTLNTITDNSNNKKATDTTPKPGTFDAKKYSVDEPTSPWVVVNKLRPLKPQNYAPSDLVVPTIPLRGNITSTEKYVRKETATALEQMIAAANTQGVHLNLQSGYRSYDFQVTLYNRYVQQQGQAAADTQSARPGYSEHQTGLAADLGGTSKPSCNVEACFADTVEGKWLATNGYKYGFVVRYPLDKTTVTGYTYEPWHMRYVGVDLASEMHSKNVLTLEEYFNLPAAPDYQ